MLDSQGLIGALGISLSVQFRMAQEYLKPQKRGVLLDVSCGSGLFTRRFVKSGDYKAVIALDFSESMLRQTSEFIKSDLSLSTSWVQTIWLQLKKCGLQWIPLSDSLRLFTYKGTDTMKFENEICRNVALVRADVARLPFGTGTIDAVHAGAALHCWPSPAAGVRVTLHYGDHYVG